MRLRHRPAVPSVTPFTLARLVPGTRYLVCDTTQCAHNTRRHIPAGTGYRCTSCQTLKGDQ
ncbi:hypothetical protein ACIG8S_24720 [[Kitasatospora] papulosa]|uniref:hypothetical protein n=1 Tax=[Kitasatospora] papulosa TaxID=1464011 RepID=UPI0037D93A39